MSDGLFSRIASMGPKAGGVDLVTGQMTTTAWEWRTEDGVYVGLDGSAWIYWALPVKPFMWARTDMKLAQGAAIEQLLMELGETSTPPIGNWKGSGINREIHLVAITWEERFRKPTWASQRHAKFLTDTLTFPIPNMALFVGVKLRAAIKDTVMGELRKLVERIDGDRVPPLAAFQNDKDRITAILARNGARRPKPHEARMLEGWWGNGNPDAALYLEPDHIDVRSTGNKYEFAAVMRFNEHQFQAPQDAWIAAAMNHAAGACAVSIRAELEPSSVTKKRARDAQRRRISDIEEQSKTGDLENPEDYALLQQSQMTEEYLARGAPATLTKTSFLFARRMTGAEETYLDELRDFGIEAKVLENRQLWALDEFQPGSQRRVGRVKAFGQDVNVGLVAYSGIQSFGTLGDSEGAWTGISIPEGAPVFVNPRRASNTDLPPTMAVIGDTGSGKTFYSQLLAFQAILMGEQVVFINPKGFDTLRPFAEAVNGEVISMGALEDESGGGAFDPFRFAKPIEAAEIAANHILSVLGDGWNQSQKLALSGGLKRGANQGARCVGEALKYVDDDEVRHQVLTLADGSSQFALLIAPEPRQPLGLGSGLTLIEFDRELGLPSASTPPSEQTFPERIAIATIRLVTRAALATLVANKGGMLLVDEAWTFLSHPASLQALEKLGREGRSLGVMPVLITQKLADIRTANLEAYIGRVTVLKLQEPREGEAALRLCGLEPTEELLAWLRDAGNKKPTAENPAGRPALGIHRDLEFNFSALMIGPVPEEIRMAISTNPEDRRKREELKRAEEAALVDTDDTGEGEE